MSRSCRFLTGVPLPGCVRSITNKLQRRLEAVLFNLRLIESKMEVKGITLRDLGITASELQHGE